MLTVDQVMWINSVPAFEHWGRRTLHGWGIYPHPLTDTVTLNNRVRIKHGGAGWKKNIYLYTDAFNEMAEAHYIHYPEHRNILLNRLDEYLRLIYCYVTDPTYFREEIITLHKLGHMLEVDIIDVATFGHHAKPWLNKLGVYPNVRQVSTYLEITGYQDQVRIFIKESGTLRLSTKQVQEIIESKYD